MKTELEQPMKKRADIDRRTKREMVEEVYTTEVTRTGNSAHVILHKRFAGRTVRVSIKGEDLTITTLNDD